MDVIYEFINAFGRMIYADNAVFEVICLVGVLVLTLLTIRNNRKAQVERKKAYDILQRLR